MKPIDIRNANFSALRALLQGLRQDVLNGLHDHGPCTTRELAARLDRDIVSVRPRVTELCQLGVAELVKAEDDGSGHHEGIYRARTFLEWEKWHTAQRAEPTQTQLPLTTI